MRRLVIGLAGFLALAVPALAGDLAELDRLRIEKIILERAVIRERLGRLQTEAVLLQVQDAGRAKDLEAAVTAASLASGLTPDEVRKAAGITP